MNLDDLLENAGKAEEFLKALANRHRLMILCELLRGESSVTALNQHLPLSQSALSQHLARLRADNLVTTRRDSQTIFYQIARSDVERVIRLLCEIYGGSVCAPDIKENCNDH
jgi:DNA-binding transcriptional ArsR family regulator